MANIDTYLAAIRNAIYGEQVRTAICNAISAINTEVTTWTGLQDGSVTTSKIYNGAVTQAKLSSNLNTMINAMKTGFDGVTYSSPAAMVQGEDQKLQDEITSDRQKDKAIYNFLAFSPNLCHNSNFTFGYVIDITNGTQKVFGSIFSVSGYEPVIPGVQYELNYTFYSSGNYGMAFYDSSKTFINGSGIKQGTENSLNPFVFTAPVGAAFVRFTNNINTIADADVTMKYHYSTNYSSLKNAIDGETEYLHLDDLIPSTNKISVQQYDGYLWKYNGDSAPTTKLELFTYSCFEYSLENVESFYIMCEANNNANARPIIFTDSNDNVVLTIGDGSGDRVHVDQVFITPPNASKMYVSYIKEYGFAFTETMLIKDYLKVQVNPSVQCYGDSLTQYDPDNKGYVKTLAALIPDHAVYNRGSGGDNSSEIGGRQGGVPMYVEPFTVPATTTAVRIYPFSSDLDQPRGFYPARQNITQLSSVTIGGIAGTITYVGDQAASGSQHEYYFTRAEAGEETEFTRPERIFDGSENQRDDIQIFWVGTNDDPTLEVIKNFTIPHIDNMIKYLHTDKYLVIGIYSKNKCADIEDVNAWMSRYYSSHFVDVRTYLLEYGLADAEITPTAQDEADIANGEVPTSLRADAVHLNKYGFPIVGNLVYKKGVELGLWE